MAIKDFFHERLSKNLMKKLKKTEKLVDFNYSPSRQIDIRAYSREFTILVFIHSYWDVLGIYTQVASCGGAEMAPQCSLARPELS